MGGFVDVVFNLPVKRQFAYRLPEGCLAPVGTRVSAPFSSRTLTGLVVAERDLPPDTVAEIREIKRVVDGRPLIDERLLELARWMSQLYLCSLGQAVFTMIPGGKRESEPDEMPPEEDARGYRLAEQQLSAIRAISEGTADTSYLFGVTGSGKSDVYLHAAQDVTAKGRGVIYLVPEITLTHQVVRLFRTQYGHRLAVLHSALSPSQRLSEWLRILDGGVDVVIGARSAVFAPVPRLGLIVIDEEHEGSYKSGSTPRYHARQVAQHRVSVEGARLVMGSATPSLEAYERMSRGKLLSLRMPDRLSGGRMPEVEIVDMRRHTGPLSAPLLDQIARTRAEGRQAILFLNRRGFSYLFHCRSCGYEMTCKHCSVSLTYHKERERMICHYCGFSARPISVCPQCGSLDVGYSGYGTEGIEEELARLFPQLVARRLDTDAVRKRKVLRQALTDFRDGKIHVLIGTQMVAKGLDFPGVKLVGIVNADTGFQLPDFRAAERTFGLLVQVSGRAGRALPDGRVLIQTFRPTTPAIVMAQQGKLEEFYAAELETRRLLGFPPYSRLIRLVMRGRNQKKAADAIGALARALASRLGDAAEVLGPAECPLARISGNYRYQIILRTTRFTEAHARASAELDA
ncbi:MAG TPA: primosomal protein N', partial [Spirochaetia bacterium]|nr:primosomal protein N' [Spirochaetia bacterium]